MRVIIFLVAVILQFPVMAVAEETLDARFNALAEKVQKIEQVVNNQALLDLAQRTADLHREVRELRGENEKLRYELNSIKTLQREQYLNLARRLQALSDTASAAGSGSTGQVVPSSNLAGTAEEASTLPAVADAPASLQPDTASSPAPAEPEGAGQVIALGSTSDATKDYKIAFTLLKSGKYDDSVSAFEEFLRKHPDSKYAANAQYWVAEANYVSKRYPRALTEFSTVVEKYPASSKLADARLKLGYTYYELGKFQEARDELTRLRAQFPNSNVAKMAQERLERMSREGY